MSQEQQFFSIPHQFLVNCQPCAIESSLPSAAEFSHMIPAPFKLASHLNHIESQALRPLRNLGESAHDLAEFLNLQSRKIDLMMNYILTLGSDNEQRLEGTSFGGSHLTFVTPQSLADGQYLKLKVFIDESNCAIFCIGKVIGQQNKDNQQLINAEIVMIEDEDQEQLVRASLHVQSNQLKERAALRNEQAKLEN